MTFIFGTIVMFVVLLAGVVGIFLQIYFSKRENKFAGLILPLLTFLNSLVALLNLTAPANRTIWELVALGAKVFISYNISTAILLIIYAAVREKRKKNRQLERMNIQDLY